MARRDPFRQMHTIETMARRIAALEQQNEHLRKFMIATAERIAGVISDVELRTLYTMSKIQRNRPKHAGLIVGARQEVETVSLLQLYEVEKDAFVESMVAHDAEENDGEDTASQVDSASATLERAKAENAAANAHTNGAGDAAHAAGANGHVIDFEQ